MMKETLVYKGGLAGMEFWGPVMPFLPLIVVWSLFWKGLALWHAARRGQNVWFIALLLINTFGILEIIYLFVVLKLKGGDLFKKY